MNKRLYDEFKLQDDVIRNQFKDKILYIVKNGSKVRVKIKKIRIFEYIKPKIKHF